jgi:hypothetical protein
MSRLQPNKYLNASLMVLLHLLLMKKFEVGLSAWLKDPMDTL